MKRFILLLCTSSGFIFSMDKPLNSENIQTQPTQTVQQPQEKKDSNNIWDRVNPADKAYPGEYAPAWGWVLTDWGD
ncbi:MAG: hypothetical protein J6R32_06445 [Bacteroidales bacterium]|nr:hypothetical protein [Bacteroidales bacterium]